MKILFFFILILACVYASVNKPNVDQLWSEFKQKYNKNYPNDAEEQQRFNIFNKNVDFIEKHNQEQHSYRLGINEFADMTQEEFSKRKGFGPIKHLR